MNIRKEYEKICPKTTWSDEELIDFLHKQGSTSINGNANLSIEIIKVDSIDKFIKENNCKHAEDVIDEFRGKLMLD